MKAARLKKHLAAVALAMGAIAATYPAWAVESFTTTYNGTSSLSAYCTNSRTIYGRQPSEPGRYPLYIYTVGTFEDANSVLAQANINEMAARGYVAVSVDYNNGSFGGCSTISARTRCIYDPGVSGSAVARLCARSNVDCSRGIVVGGFSQGSVIAALSRNYDTRVRAAYGMGIGTEYSTYDLRSCMADGRRSLPSDRLRAVNGVGDTFFGGSSTSGRANLVELTGLSCGSTAYSCTRANGSGWYMVRHSEVTDGDADHCYQSNSGCSSYNALDTNYRDGTGYWLLGPSLDWLVNFTD